MEKKDEVRLITHLKLHILSKIIFIESIVFYFIVNIVKYYQIRYTIIDCGRLAVKNKI